MQKIAVRAKHLLGEKDHIVKLVEVNCHSLFSKWFSESGKLIFSLFEKIKGMASDPNVFVCILIDEVESMSISRKETMKSHEPSDSVRAVNALLTQMDQVKEHSNILILATSNLIESIDSAFLDRIDRLVAIGNPGPKAIYNMWASSIRELMRHDFLCQVNTKLF